MAQIRFLAIQTGGKADKFRVRIRSGSLDSETNSRSPVFVPYSACVQAPVYVKLGTYEEQREARARAWMNYRALGGERRRKRMALPPSPAVTENYGNLWGGKRGRAMCSTVIWQPEGGEVRGGAAPINYFNSRPREILPCCYERRRRGRRQRLMGRGPRNNTPLD